MTAREIADLFADLELRLIQSLRRNLAAHKSREKAEGGQNGVPAQWPAWQAEKLRSLNRFRQQNEQIAGEFSTRIDTETRAMLQAQFAEADGNEGAFFGVNADKVNALIEEITAAESNAQKAALRYMDDVYRQTILRADVALTAGGVTMQQAVDLATQDFLRQGITCIRYKNGRRVNIASYAEMALRTSNTRAMLLGEAQKRERMGIDTVLVSQYGACSETCLPWQGLVYIDDVWQPYHGDSNAGMGGSYGTSRNGRSYPLLSVAVRAGLFHPNCRHTLGSWIEGVSRRPRPMDKAKIEAASKLEAKQRELELRVRQDKRLAAGTQDPERVKAYKAQLRKDQKELREFIAAHDDVLRRDPWRERADIPAVQPTGGAFTSPPSDGILKSSDRNGGNPDVNFVCRLDRELYSVITDDIQTDEVIITDERIKHVKEHHPNDYERFNSYLAEIVQKPDYIIRDDRPYTGMLLKEFTIGEKGEHFRIALRLATSRDPAHYKNSIITFLKIREREWRRLIRNKEILYKAK